MAKYYNLDPQVVNYTWTNKDFLDYQEYMLVMIELERKERERQEADSK